MKRNSLIITVLIFSTDVVFGQQTLQYKPLQQGKRIVDIELIDAEPAKKDSLRGYCFYQLFSEYYKSGTVDKKMILTEIPWRVSALEFDIESAKTTARNYMDSLKTELSFDVPVIRLLSRPPLGKSNSNLKTTEIADRVEVFHPENPKMNGIITPSISWLNDARIRLTYNFSKTDSDEPVLVSRIESCTDSVAVNPKTGKKERIQSIGLCLDTEQTDQINALSIEMEIVPMTNNYAVQKIDRQSTGQTLTFCNTTFTVTAFENGTAHLLFNSMEDVFHFSRKLQTKLFFGNNDQIYDLPNTVVMPVRYSFYDFAMSRRNLSYDQFYNELNQLQSPTIEPVVLYISPNAEGEFDSIYLTSDQTPVIGYRNLLMLKSEDYQPSYFLRNTDGVLSGVAFESGSDIPLPEFPNGSFGLVSFFTKNTRYKTISINTLVETTITKKGR